MHTTIARCAPEFIETQVKRNGVSVLVSAIQFPRIDDFTKYACDCELKFENGKEFVQHKNDCNSAKKEVPVG